MENNTDKDKVIMKMSFRFHSIKKLIQREPDDHPDKTALNTTITKKLNKAKAINNGRQVSFSKKIEEIPQTIAEIKNTIQTPTKNEISSNKYRPTKEHIKTPFRLKHYNTDMNINDDLLCKRNLFCNNDKEDDNKNNKSDDDIERDSDSEEKNDNKEDNENNKSVEDSDSDSYTNSLNEEQKDKKNNECIDGKEKSPKEKEEN